MLIKDWLRRYITSPPTEEVGQVITTFKSRPMKPIVPRSSLSRVTPRASAEGCPIDPQLPTSSPSCPPIPDSVWLDSRANTSLIANDTNRRQNSVVFRSRCPWKDLQCTFLVSASFLSLLRRTRRLTHLSFIGTTVNT